MAAGAITFDFHNTLVHCDSWFQLEVRALPGAFLRLRAERGGNPRCLERVAAADQAYKTLRAAIIEHGHELTAERCLALVLERVGDSASDDEIATGVETLMAAILPSSTLVEGAAETVALLATAGVPLGVVSSAVYHPFLEWALIRHGLRQYFGVVTTSASAGYYKSRPEVYWAALDALGATSAPSLHVGDSYRFDVLGAHRAGMRAAWLSRDSSDGDRADLRFESLVGAGTPLLTAFRTSSP